MLEWNNLEYFSFLTMIHKVCSLNCHFDVCQTEGALDVNMLGSIVVLTILQLHPEVERYEWIIIHHPELAKAETWTHPAEDAEQMATSKLLQTKHENAADHEHSDARQIGGLSPFLATRHFNLPSKSASMFMFGNNDFIIIGGGDGEALHIDGDLDHGHSSHCNTFDNPPLCSENFRIQILEVWAFGDAHP
uniref:TLDc domain-containing protein n=1 Tax=Eptatretus burgeri TaxID=7764 RepID=A0A8C4R984_EPTBU